MNRPYFNTLSAPPPDHRCLDWFVLADANDIDFPWSWRRVLVIILDRATSTMSGHMQVLDLDSSMAPRRRAWHVLPLICRWRRRSHGRGHVPLDSSTAASSSTEADPSNTGTDAVCIYTFVHMQRTKPACIRRRQSAATSSTPRQPTGVHVRGLGLYALRGTNFPRHDQATVHAITLYSLLTWFNLIG